MCRLPGPSGMTLWWPGVTSSALCGTDLHMYGGPYGGRCLAWCSVTKGWESSRTSAGLRTVCSAVTVSRCPRISTAVCFNCARGGSAACLRGAARACGRRVPGARRGAVLRFAGGAALRGRDGTEETNEELCPSTSSPPRGCGSVVHLQHDPLIPAVRPAAMRPRTVLDLAARHAKSLIGLRWNRPPRL